MQGVVLVIPFIDLSKVTTFFLLYKLISFFFELTLQFLNQKPKISKLRILRTKFIFQIWFAQHAKIIECHFNR